MGTENGPPTLVEGGVGNTDDKCASSGDFRIYERRSLAFHLLPVHIVSGICSCVHARLRILHRSISSDEQGWQVRGHTSTFCTVELNPLRPVEIVVRRPWSASSSIFVSSLSIVVNVWMRMGGESLAAEMANDFWFIIHFLV